MYVIGHLYYLELTEKLPLHADARTRLFNQLPDYNILDCLKFVMKGMKILFVKKMHCLIFPMIFTAIFLRASKNLSCGNVPDGG